MSKNEVDNCKILLFTASFPPPAAGGSVEYLYNIFSNFPPNSVVVHTGNSEKHNALSFDATFQQRVIRSSYIIHVVNGHKATKLHSMIQNLFWPFNACKLILKEQPNVIVIGEFSIVSIAVMAFRILFKTPYVLFTYAEEITYLDSRPLYKSLLQYVLKYASAVFTVSEYTRTLLIQRGAAPHTIHKVLPSVGESKCLLASKEDLVRTITKYGLRGKNVLLTVGRIVERKGHETVIQAMPSVLNQVPNLKYIIVGIGPHERALKEKVNSLGLHEHVAFAGCSDDIELSTLYDLCNVFVMPHRKMSGTNDTEGCPTVFLEASAHGKPCIGGDAGGVSDAIMHNITGLIVDGTDTYKVSQAISYLLVNDDVAQKMGRAGREYVAKLSPEANSRIVQSVIASLHD